MIRTERLFSRLARTYLMTDCLGSHQEDACLESAATESVDLGKDSNFLGSQNFLRSSNHRVWGVEHSARGRMLWDVKCKRVARKLLNEKAFPEDVSKVN